MGKEKREEKTQETRTGHSIPMPKRGEFLDNLKKVSEAKEETEDDSAPDSAKEERPE